MKKRETVVLTKWGRVEGVTLKLYPRNEETDEVVVVRLAEGIGRMMAGLLQFDRLPALAVSVSHRVVKKSQVWQYFDDLPAASLWK